MGGVGGPFQVGIALMPMEAALAHGERICSGGPAPSVTLNNAALFDGGPDFFHRFSQV